MKFACHNCGQHLDAEPAMLGAQIDCPVCQTALVIPTEASHVLKIPLSHPPRPAPAPAAEHAPGSMRGGESMPRPRFSFSGRTALMAASLLVLVLVTGYLVHLKLSGQPVLESLGAARLLPFLDHPGLTGIKVFPPEVHLDSRSDRQSIVVQAYYQDGVTRDISRHAAIRPRNKSLVAWNNGALHPRADGETELEVTFRGQKQTVPVTVRQSEVDRPLTFRLDVVPAFTKAGCNSGGCHGSSRGKDGFRLSLFGYDPEGDYYRLTREAIGRRINLALPEESLLIEKALGTVQHTGGQRFEAGSELHQTLLQWLIDGATTDATNLPHVVGLDIMPPHALLEGAQSRQNLTVRARYSDGTDRDVTTLAVYASNNDGVAAVSEQGEIEAGQRGEAFVSVRFDTITDGVQVFVIPEDLNYEWPEPTAYNYIDELVYAKLQKLRLTPSGLCDDQTFLRRVYLDITGTLPTPVAIQAFLDDPSAGKRDRVIDELLERPEFADLWVMQWAERLQIRSNRNQFSYKSSLQYFNWLREAMLADQPMDAVAQKLITASGSTFENPPANYYQVERDTLKLAENTAQVFMGMRIQCAQCHNHPFDRWTMNDYYSFAAFFSQVGRKSAEDPREYVVFNKREGDVIHPVNKQIMSPRFLGGRLAPEDPEKDRRHVLAEWIASPENPWFARNLANMVWAHFMGKGIIDPIDDVRVSNPPSNPELLDALGEKFTEYQYNFKKLVRDICQSRTYQLSTRANDDNGADDRNFARAAIRRLRAEVLLDCISQVTATPDKFKGLPLGARAVQIADGNVNNYFLTTFGRSTRQSVCSCEVKIEPNLSQALHLLNGSTVNSKIERGGVVTDQIERGVPPETIAEDLYLRCLSRKPQPAEREMVVSHLKRGRKPEEVLNDLFWALLNSKEFIFNH